MSIDIGVLRGVLTAVLFSAFIALWAWAWKKTRQADFDRAANLPLEDDAAPPSSAPTANR